MQLIMKKNIMMLLTAVLALSACYKEAALDREVHDPAFTIEDSSEPGKHAIYELYKNFGIATFYEYNDVDYKWNMNSYSNYNATRIDPAFLEPAMNYLEDVFFGLYDNSFKKSYMPFKIYLASELTSESSDETTDVYATSVRSGMIVGRLREDALPKTPEEYKAAAGELSASLWANYLVQNERLSIPDEFYDVSKDYYGVNSLSSAVNLQDYMTEGFLDYDHTNSLNNGTTYLFLPKAEMDIYQYVQKITTTSSEEMQAFCKKYDKIRIKYNILVNAVKSATGVDLQAIGDQVAAKYPTE